MQRLDRRDRHPAGPDLPFSRQALQTGKVTSRTLASNCSRVSGYLRLPCASITVRLEGVSTSSPSTVKNATSGFLLNGDALSKVMMRRLLSRSSLEAGR